MCGPKSPNIYIKKESSLQKIANVLKTCGSYCGPSALHLTSFSRVGTRNFFLSYLCMPKPTIVAAGTEQELSKCFLSCHFIIVLSRQSSAVEASQPWLHISTQTVLISEPHGQLTLWLAYLYWHVVNAPHQDWWTARATNPLFKIKLLGSLFLSQSSQECLLRTSLVLVCSFLNGSFRDGALCRAWAWSIKNCLLLDGEDWWELMVVAHLPPSLCAQC